jgi:hypothetical protein
MYSFCIAIKRFISVGQTALDTPPVSVMLKSQIPPSGDKHDYLSQAVDFWPNSGSPDGLPYIRWTGHINPEYLAIPDSNNFELMNSRFSQLSIIYYYTNDLAYATTATDLLRTWFVTPATRMNPNMNYAGYVPGYIGARGQGIIQMAPLVLILEYLELVKPSGLWTPQDDASMTQWLTEYYQWLKTDVSALVEGDRQNNHGTYYDLQVAAIGYRLGDDAFVRETITNSTIRIAYLMAADGSFPSQVSQPRSFYASAFNLRGLFYLANIAERYNLDLWNFEGNGRSLKLGLDFLTKNVRQWPFPDIEGEYQILRADILVELIIKAQIAWGWNKEYAAVMRDAFVGVRYAAQPLLQFHMTQYNFGVSPNQSYFAAALAFWMIFQAILCFYYFYLYKFFYKTASEVEAMEAEEKKLRQMSIPETKTIAV